jgi:hypothetical protein
MTTPLQLAILFHDTYEQLAPDFGYETREDTRQFNPESKNGRLMIAVCEDIMKRIPFNSFCTCDHKSHIKSLLHDVECERYLPF